MNDATINTQAIINIAQPFILDMGGAALTIIMAFLAKHIKNAKLREAIEAAIQRAAGGVYETLVAQSANIADIPVKNAAIASSVNSLLAAYPMAIRTFGLTPETLHEMVRKELGTLLASDPNVSVTNAGAGQGLRQRALQTLMSALPTTPPIVSGSVNPTIVGP